MVNRKKLVGLKYFFPFPTRINLNIKDCGEIKKIAHHHPNQKILGIEWENNNQIRVYKSNFKINTKRGWNKKNNCPSQKQILEFGKKKKINKFKIA